MSVRVLLVDDSSEFLQSAARFLTIDPQVEIVGCALSVPEALQQVDRLHPDLVLMDLAMPGTNGLEATRRIKAELGAPRVIILTLYDFAEYRAEAQAACADGFVAKSALDVELPGLIRSLFAGPP
jgi:DNA-binding NarL/FixJ family response regulator